jgi:hypothetical protein
MLTWMHSGRTGRPPSSRRRPARMSGEASRRGPRAPRRRASHRQLCGDLSILNVDRNIGSESGLGSGAPPTGVRRGGGIGRGTGRCAS